MKLKIGQKIASKGYDGSWWYIVTRITKKHLYVVDNDGKKWKYGIREYEWCPYEGSPAPDRSEALRKEVEILKNNLNKSTEYLSRISKRQLEIINELLEALEHGAEYTEFKGGKFLARCLYESIKKAKSTIGTNLIKGEMLG